MLPTEASAISPCRRLAEVAWVFLRLGLIGFGGPSAHVGLMEQEVVRRRGWVTHEQFMDLLGATNLIPGPNSTEMACHLGHRRAGWIGLPVGGIAFILPSFLLVWALAWASQLATAMPRVHAVLHGIKPVLIAVILQALVALARTAVRSRGLAALAAGALLLGFWGVDELALLLGAGLVAVAAMVEHRTGEPAAMPAPPLASAAVGAAVGTTSTLMPVALLPLFLVFLKVGAIMFGSGYVLFAFLQTELVDRRGWLTQAQLLEAIAIGQVTPGPISTAATFVGYRIAGSLGAVAATAGIFLPAFVFVALSGPLVPRLRRSRQASAFLDGVNVAALALMAVTTWRLSWAAVVDPLTLFIAVGAAMLLLRYQINSLWLLLAGGLLGIAAAP